MSRRVARAEDRRILAALLSGFNHVTRPHLERWDVNFAAIHLEVAMTDHLSRLCAAGTETHAVHDVVEPLLKHAKQILTGDSGHLAGFFEQVPELPFEQPVVPASLLLFTKLKTIADNLGLAVLAVLAGNEVAALNRALFCMTPLPLQEELHSLTPAQPADGTTITSHR
jgi:hypothetical protein